MPHDYLVHLTPIADEDVAALRHADLEYGDSFRKRGGVGAFMMLARKWDRIEHQLTDCGSFDVFAAMADAGFADDIRDLRRYLMLVEAEVCARAGD